MLVPMWLRGVVQLLMAIIVRIITNTGDGGQDCESHDDDNSEVLAEDKEHVEANANRVPVGPSDCNRGMFVWPSTVNPMRGIAKDGRPRNIANDHRGLGQGCGSLSGRMFLAHKGSCDSLVKRT